MDWNGVGRLPVYLAFVGFHSCCLFFFSLLAITKAKDSTWEIGYRGDGDSDQVLVRSRY